MCVCVWCVCEVCGVSMCGVCGSNCYLVFSFLFEVLREASTSDIFLISRIALSCENPFTR